MDLRDLLRAVAAEYDGNTKATADGPGQQRLREAGRRVAEVVPPGLHVQSYGGQGFAAATPWIGIFDPDETIDPGNGLYLAYIYAADLKSVTLTLQQGVTRLKAALGQGEKLRKALRKKSREIFQNLPSGLVVDWDYTPEFQDARWRPAAYEASSVAARRYLIAEMPQEKELSKDLWHMVELLQRASAAKGRVKIIDPSVTDSDDESGGSPDTDGSKGLLDGFRPKDSSDYVQQISARQQVKSRRHESLVTEFAGYAAGRGFEVATINMHPRDMVLKKSGEEWLVEAKVVRAGNPTKAVREAVGQLFEYSHFLYGGQRPHMLALFTEDVGVYAPYLEGHRIGSVWRAPEAWLGSPLTVEWGLA